ncbi:hypothetical protein [Vreelandella titanicae]|uniref:Uncharacterized protein n=1 Tax=Vreelandella titanicae TaxID=664683 RepID=A0A558JEM0_9GAMM|nr:hypothetical protein [Halomonas titanicae]TVU92083.1 hypothetical protein FQP89_02860 [Halomonas titanicae]
MLYQVLTLRLGTSELDEEASKVLSREAKKGFLVQEVTSCIDSDGNITNSYLLERAPIEHLPSQPEDPKGLKRIKLGDRVFYWDPCGDEPDVTK